MQTSNDNLIGSYEAKTHFSELLERVAAGEEITITKHGSPIARLMPVRSIPTVEDRKEAIRKIKELARENRLDGLRIKDLIAEGRR